MAVPIAPVVATKPQPTVDVPGIVARREPLLAWEAEAYCANVLPENATAKAHAGWRQIRCLWCPGVPCAYTYGVAPTDNCLWFPFTCVLLPLPLPNPLPICCASERHNNQWILRKDVLTGAKDGAWVIVDEEKKTIAAYSVKDKSSTKQLNDKPDCYCEKFSLF